MSKSIESMLEEIESIAEAMQNGELSLEDAIRQYEKAVILLQNCQKSLHKAERSIKMLEERGEQLIEKDFAEHDKEDGSESLASYTGTGTAANGAAIPSKSAKNSPKKSHPDLF